MLVLRELAQTMPTYFFQQVEQFFELIFNAIHDPKPVIREGAIEALRAALVVTAQRESTKQLQHTQWYKFSFEQANKLKTKVDKHDKGRDERAHGYLLVINELLRCSNAEWERKYVQLLEITDTRHFGDDQQYATNKPKYGFHKRTQYQNLSKTSNILHVVTESTVCRKLMMEVYRSVCADVLSHRSSRYSYTQQVLIAVLPRLAAFDSELFVQEYLEGTMMYLFSTLGGRDKDKAAAYITIGLIAVAVGKPMFDTQSEYLTKLMHSIKQALPSKEATIRKRTKIDPSVLKCVTLLAHAANKDERFKKEVVSILDQMFQTGLSRPLTICFRELAKNVPCLKDSISAGLLKMLHQILMNKPLRHPGMPKNLPADLLSLGSDTHEPCSIVLALHTLGTFDFEGASLLDFVKRCAEHFLIHEQQKIRLEAVRTCSRLLKQALHQSAEHPSETVNLTVAAVLNKLLVVGMTDTDSDVRLWVLYSLDSTFDNYLAQAESLSALFVALHDEVFEIREVALYTIGGLSTLNPAYVMPSLRKTLVQLLTELEHSGTGRNKEQGAKLLDYLILSAPRLVRPYMEPVLKVLVPKLREPEPYPGVVLAVLKAIGDLAEVTAGGSELHQWMDELMGILMDMLGDASAPDKRGAALITLGKLVGATGHVVKPYTQYPVLLDVLMNFLKTEQLLYIRRETIRVLGLLGALDPYKHKMNRGQIDYHPEAPLLIPYTDKTTDPNADLSSSEMLVNMSSSTLEEYYLAMVIATLMKILRDPTLGQHHTMAVQAVSFTFKSLGIKCVPYISQVLPSLLNVVRTPEVNITEFLFQQLAHLILIVKQHIRNYLDDICALIKEFWTPHSTIQKTLITLVENIAIALGAEFKVYLPKLMPQILRVLSHNSTKDNSVVMRMLEALHKFGNNLEDYMHLILPPIVKLFDAQESTVPVAKQALDTIDQLAGILDFSDFISRIVHPLVRTIDTYPELREAAMETLCSLVIQLRRKFLIFDRLVTKVLTKHKITNTAYPELIGMISKSTTLCEDRDVLQEKLRQQAKVKHGDTTNIAVDATTIQRLKVSKTALQQTWTATRRVSKDDWLEWSRKLSLELLKQSPIAALRSCISLAQSYTQLPKDLFNASFVSCWTEIDDMHDELIRNLKDALVNADIPEITQTILNLAEFMEHCDKGPLPIDPELLGEKAMHCRAYAKALHYKEEEFNRGVNPKVVEALISINNKLQQKEAAEGLLQHVKPKMDLEVRWYEKLHNWDKALSMYKDILDKNTADHAACLGQMRCLEALGEWNDLHELVAKRFDILPESEKVKASRLAAASAWGIKDWESMEKYTKVMPRESQDGAFYRAVLSIHKEQYDDAQRFIDSARDLIDTELTAMAGESYERAYNAMVFVQMLAELEEVIQYRLVPERQPTLRTMWWQRLQSGQRVVEDWQRIIQVHSLVLSPEQDIHTWLKYASLCRKSGSLMLSHKTLVMLLGFNPEEKKYQLTCDQPQVTFAYTKHLWMAGNKSIAYKKLEGFLKEYTDQGAHEDVTHEERRRLLARCFMKLGEWQENLEGVTETSIPSILNRYQSATEHDSLWYKAWHSWAYMNFESVLFYKKQAEKSPVNYIPFAVNAVEGFFKSINLSKGSSLQDTLRLLTLWFDYGQVSEVYDAIVDGIRLIEMNTWLQVIPQLIARIDTKTLVSTLVHLLLIDIGKTHPQALIYPLTVATKSTSFTRRQAANKILKSMSEHWPGLVKQALMASEELIRVAILWHEMWHEGLEEASRYV